MPARNAVVAVNLVALRRVYARDVVLFSALVLLLNRVVVTTCPVFVLLQVVLSRDHSTQAHRQEKKHKNRRTDFSQKLPVFIGHKN